MRTGFFVMLDALGYKRIWRPREPGESEDVRAEKVLSKMKALRRQTTRLNRGMNGTMEVEFRCDCISDTIAIGIWPTSNGALSEPSARSLVVAACIASFSTAAVESDPPLVYRGAVAYGRFEMDDGFIVGPAVDEAANYMETAQAAIVRATDSATAKLAHESEITFPYSVPLSKKRCGGGSHETLAFAPWAMIEPNLSKNIATAGRILKTFDAECDDVREKKENTRLFLVEALRRAREVALGHAPDQTKVPEVPSLLEAQ